MVTSVVPCVGAVVLDGRGRLLLVRRRNAPAAGCWTLPGGRVEAGEDDAAAVAREVLEETGLAVTVGPLVGAVERDGPAGPAGPVVFAIRDYACSPPADAPAPVAGDDASAAAWCTPDEVRALPTSPGLVEALDSWAVLPPAVGARAGTVILHGVDDPWGLQRFVDAQQPEDSLGSYGTALRELRAGRKRGHWMWYVFPQVAGLGRSPAAQYYAISGLPEARAYLAHPVLGPRLRECARVVAELPGGDPVALLGPVDALKLRSSMTLFARAAPEEPVFAEVLGKYFGGRADDATLALL